jgi:GNAT superfamily N-acetyltransferase
MGNFTCYGVYHGHEQIGFARVVTDQTSMYWVCDVFIDEGYLGRGLGKWLIENIAESGAYRGLKGIVATRDAHGLYERFGSQRDPARFLIKVPGDSKRIADNMHL